MTCLVTTSEPLSPSSQSSVLVTVTLVVTPDNWNGVAGTIAGVCHVATLGAGQALAGAGGSVSTTEQFTLSGMSPADCGTLGTRLNVWVHVPQVTVVG